MPEIRFIFIVIFLSLCSAEISYLQISSEEINSAEFGIKNGIKGTTCPCGLSNKNSARILGGNNAQKNEFPFAVALIDKYTKFIFCGGTLITNLHVITGAHCTWRRRIENDPIAAVLAEHDVTKESIIRQTIDVHQIIEHENFNRITLINDIALLVLKEKLIFNKFIGPVCLPIDKRNIDHKYVRIIGWGSIKKDGGNTDVLKKVDIRVVPLKICSYNYIGQVNATIDKQICTFGRRKGSCQGDSGGPVLWLDSETNRYTLIGIVSFGKGCATTVPSVNTQVFSYINWIKNKIKSTNAETNICTRQD